MCSKHLKEKTLLEECLEALAPHVTIMSHDESSKIFKTFEKIAPFLWLRINWEKVDKKIEVISSDQIIPTLNQLLPAPIDRDIYIFWNDADLPMLKTDLNSALYALDHITRLGIETWLFNNSQWYVVELHFGEIHVGILPDLQTAELYSKDETIIFKNNGQKHYCLVTDKFSHASSEMQTLKEFLSTITDINIIDEINKLKNDNSSHNTVVNDITLIKSSEGKIELKNGTSSLIISFENLISIVNKWCSLLKHNVPYIILNLKGSLYSEDVYSLKGTQSIEDILK